MSSAEAVETGLTAAEVAASSAPADFSSCASSFSSSESLSMMTMPSPGGPRRSRLSSPKRHWVNSKSRAVSWMGSSSSEGEYRSTAEAFLEGPPYLNTGERGRWEDTSAGDPGGDGVSDDAGGGLMASLAARLPSAEGECSRLMHLLPSIVEKRRTREENPKQKRDEEKECEMVSSGE
jgi:hypothetical protein